MEITINGKVGDDPRDCVLALEAVTKSICEKVGQDPAFGVMMLLTAAVHLSTMRTDKPVKDVIEVMAGCLGNAAASADDMFRLRPLTTAQKESEK